MEVSLELFGKVVVKYSAVSDGVKEHGLGRLPVSSCSSYLLEVAFYCTREATMHYEAYIRFVNPKPEGNRGYHHFCPTLHPVSLYSFPLSV